MTLNPNRDRLHPMMGKFSDIPSLLNQHLQDSSTGGLDAIVFDVGMSSNQLDDPSRGFSYQHDGPLDMRMSGNDSDSDLTASTIVNRNLFLFLKFTNKSNLISSSDFTENQLAQILKDFGEESQALKIARGIVQHRDRYGFLETTKQLSDLVIKITSNKYGRWRLGERHPAVRTYEIFSASTYCNTGEAH
jgi:16S rRNA (cytosine1402-N4)-methyltransferase